MGAERTFERNISQLSELQKRLKKITDTVAERMVQAAVMGHTITLKIKYHDFEVTTRQTTSPGVIYDREELFEVADLLLRHAPEPRQRPVRLLGVSVSNLRSLQAGVSSERLALDFKQTAGKMD